MKEVEEYEFLSQEMGLQLQTLFTKTSGTLGKIPEISLR